MSRRGVFGGKADELTRLAVYQRSEQAIEAHKTLSTPPLIRFSLAAVGGIFLLMAQGGALWAWFGALALMLALHGAPPALGAGAGALAAAIACFRIFPAYDGHGVFWLILALNVPAGAVVGVLASLISTRLPANAFAFLAALLPAGLEHLGGLTAAGPLGSTALTQYAVPAIVCMGRLGGCAGVTYVIFLFGAAAAAAISYMRNPRLAFSSSVPALAVVALGLLYGALSSANSASSVEVMAFNLNSQAGQRIQLVSKPDYDLDAWTQYINTINETVGRLARRIAIESAINRAEEQKTMQLLVGPEAAAVVNAETRALFVKQVEAISRTAGCAIAMGFYDFDTTESIAVLTGSQGTVDTEYVRRNFIPGADDSLMAAQMSARGDERPEAVDTLFGRAAVLLSFDANDFGNFRSAAREAARVVCVCGFDDVAVPKTSVRVLVFNAALSGLPVVRSAMKGELLVIDADGRIVTRDDTVDKADSQVIAPVPLGEGGTLFLTLGNAFAWLALLAGLAAGLLASSLPGPPKPEREHKPSSRLSYKTKEGLKDI